MPQGVRQCAVRYAVGGTRAYDESVRRGICCRRSRLEQFDNELRGGGALNDENAEGPNDAATNEPEPEAPADEQTPSSEPEAPDVAPEAETSQQPVTAQDAWQEAAGSDDADDNAAGPADPAEPVDSEPAPIVYATWNDVAAAVEDGTLADGSFKPAGTGTQADPYVLAVPEAFAWWALLHPNASAQLGADIDLTAQAAGETSRPEDVSWPGDTTLGATLDGQGHTLLFVTEGAGLFKEIAQAGRVEWLHLGLTDKQKEEPGARPTAVAATGALAGAVAGTNKGAIQGVVNRMDVTASGEDADATAKALAGGIVAVNDGTVEDCANLGAVSVSSTSDASCAAGIAAAGTGSVKTSYNVGALDSARAAAHLAVPGASAEDYANQVDEASCYLAPEQGVSFGGTFDERAGALSAKELQASAKRLNAGRTGDDAVWAQGGATDGLTRGFPVPTESVNIKHGRPAGTNLHSDTVETAPVEPPVPDVLTETVPTLPQSERPAKQVTSWEVPEEADYEYAPYVADAEDGSGKELTLVSTEPLAGMTADEAAAALLPKQVKATLSEQDADASAGDPADATATPASGGAPAGDPADVPAFENEVVDSSPERSIFDTSRSLPAPAADDPTVMLDVAWTSDDYDQAVVTQQGATFTAQLPEGYALADGALPLVIAIPSGEAATLANPTYADWGAVGQAVADAADAASIAAGAAGTVSIVLPNGTSKSVDIPAYHAASGGFRISTPEQLAWFAYQVDSHTGTAVDAAGTTYGTASVRLDANIDLAGTDFGKSVTSGGADDAAKYSTCLPWKPIKQIGGTFDGGSRTVSNLYISDSTPQTGFIRSMRANSVVENVGLASGYVYNAAAPTGSLVGSTEDAGVRLENCYNATTVESTKFNLGGLIGRTDEGKGKLTIRNCYNTGSVTQTGGDSVGGIIGKIHGDDDLIENCYNLGAISGVSKAGGIVGDTNKTRIVVKNCYNAGTVNSGNGLVGGTSNSFTFENCLVDSSKVAGTGAASSAGALLADAAAMRTWGTAYQLNGGATGGDGSGATSTMSTWRMPKDANSDGSLTATDENQGYPVLVSLGGANAAGLKRMDDAKDWSDVGAWIDAFNPKDARGAAFKPTGSGADDDPYLIGTPEAFAWLGYHVNSANADAAAIARNSARLTAPIDLAGLSYGGRVNPSGADAEAMYKDALTWVPIGTTEGGAEYWGIFDGKKRAITRMNIGTLHANSQSTYSRGNIAGLFGFIGYGGDASLRSELRDVTLGSGVLMDDESPDGSADGLEIGALAASGYRCAIINCSNEGVDVIVRGGSRGLVVAGGLVGTFDRTTNLFGCLNAAAVTVEEQVGDEVLVAGIAGSLVDGGAYLCVNAGTIDVREHASGKGLSYAAGITALANGSVYSYVSTCANIGSIAPHGAFRAAGLMVVQLGMTLGKVHNSYSVGMVHESDDSCTYAITNNYNTGFLNYGADAPCFYAFDVMESYEVSVGVSSDRVVGNSSDSMATSPFALLMNNILAAGPLPTGDFNSPSNLTLPSERIYVDVYEWTSDPSVYGGYPTPQLKFTNRVPLNLISWLEVGQVLHEQGGSAGGNLDLTAESGTLNLGRENPYSETDEISIEVPKIETDSDGFLLVSTAEQLAWILYTSTIAANLRDKDIRLTADIDLAGTMYGFHTSTGATDYTKYQACMPWNAFCESAGAPYNGTFDGNGHSIRNMNCDSSAIAGADNTAQGFIGFLGSAGTVKNLSLESGLVLANSLYIGGIVGRSEGTIQNCSNAAYVRRDSSTPPDGGWTGGVVGGTYSLVSESVVDCLNTGLVQDMLKNTGGIVGLQGESSNIVRCVNTGQVVSNSPAGGLVGQLGSRVIAIVDSYNTGLVSGSSTGGLVGYKNAACDLSIERCYNIGSVKNAFIGQAASNRYIIADSYVLQGSYTGDLQGGMALSSDQLKSWGVAYQLNGALSGGTDGSGDVSAMNTWRMASQVDANGDGVPDENAGYPVLISTSGDGVQQDGTTPATTMQNAKDWEQVGAWVDTFDPKLADGSAKIKPATDGSSEAQAFKLVGPEALAWYSYKVKNDASYAGKYVKLSTASGETTVDLTGARYGGAFDVGAATTKDQHAGVLPWLPIGETVESSGSHPFSGTFDATGAPIEHLYSISAGDNVTGLIWIAHNATIAGVDLASGWIEGRRDSGVGALVSYATGTLALTSCRNAADVRNVTSEGTGGLLGWIDSSSSLVVDKCVNEGTVEGADVGAGGLIGAAYVSDKLVVSDSWNDGRVQGDFTTGGLLGLISDCEHASIVNCLNTGTVESDSDEAGAIVGVRQSGTTYSVANCYYASPSVSNTEGGTLKTADEFASGEVAWLLDTADGASGAPAADSAVHRGVWGQQIKRDAALGVLLPTGDAYPSFLSAIHPKVLRAAFTCSDGSAADSSYANVGSTVRLPLKADGGAYAQYRLGSQTGTLVTSPYTMTEVTGDVHIYAQGFSSWFDVGGAQTEATLRAASIASGTDGVSNLDADVTAALSGGDGSSAENAIVIASPEALAWFMAKTRAADAADRMVGTASGGTGVDARAAFVKLAADLDLLGAAYTGEDAAAGDFSNCLPWSPIAQHDAAQGFAGTIDGRGHSLSNFFIESDGNGLALVAMLEQTGTIRNLVIASGRNTSVTAGGSSGYAAAFAGTCKGLVEDCVSHIDVNHDKYVGGIVGEGFGGARVVRCANYGSISASDEAGGIAGSCNGGVEPLLAIDSCFNRGAVHTEATAWNAAAGGICARLASRGKVAISNCYNTGTVTAASGSNAFPIADGGQVVANSFYDKETVGDKGASTGIAAITTAQLKSWGAAYQLNGGAGIKNASGAITGNVGDAAVWRMAANDGENEGYPVLCTAGGTMTPASNWSQVGRWVQDFVNADEENASGLVMKPDLADIQHDGSSPDKPIKLASPEALAWFAAHVNEGSSGSYPNANLSATLAYGDIDLLGSTYTGDSSASAEPLLWTPIGTTSSGTGAMYGGTFSGSYTGPTKTISHLRIETGTQGSWGLFGCAGETAVIRGITLSDVDLTWEHAEGTSLFAAPLLGSGTKGARIERCGVLSGTNAPKADGIATGTGLRAVSGLVGNIEERAGVSQNAVVADCFVNMTVVDGGPKYGEYQRAAGIVGRNGNNNGCDIANCYISAGVVGTADGTSLGVEVAHIYGARTAVVSNCYYNTDKDGSTDSWADSADSEIKGISTDELQQPLAVIRLNAGRGADTAPWAMDASAPNQTNGGFPVLGEGLLIGSWADAAKLLSESALRDTPVLGASAGLKALSGSGSVESPYVISSPEALAWFALQVNAKGSQAVVNVKNAGTADITFAEQPTRTASDGTETRLTYAYASVKLGADIDLTGAVYGATLSAPLEWVPLGTNGSKYNGVFDGANLEVSHLFIDSTESHAGLVGFADVDSLIQNLTVSGSVSSTGEAVGGVTGAARGSLRNCVNKADVVGGDRVGGVVGDFSGTDLADCTNEGSVRGGEYVAGVAGYGDASEVSGCSNTGDITGEKRVAGISGWSDSLVADCMNAGDITATAAVADENTSTAAGIVSVTSDEALRCVNKGSVTASNADAVAVGITYDSVRDCLNLGSVSASGDGGAASGLAYRSTVNVNSASAGSVTASGAGGKAAVAYFDSYAHSVIANVYYDKTVLDGTYLDVPDGTPAAGIVAAETTEFMAGGIAWALDTALADTGAASSPTVQRGVWGQTIARDADGNLDASVSLTAYAGDVYPVVKSLVTADAAPSVYRFSYTVDSRLAAGDVSGADASSYANASGKLALPFSPTNRVIEYRVGSETGTAVTSPWDLGAYAAAGSLLVDQTIFVILSFGSWQDVGSKQVEGDLRLTTVNAAGTQTKHESSSALEQAVAAGETRALAGSGSAAEPYLVATPEALAWWANQVNSHNAEQIANDASVSSPASTAYGAASVAIARDLDLTGSAYGGTSDAPLAWVPVGIDHRQPYRGAFDGGGFTIDHLLVNDTSLEYAGLLGYATGSGASVKNVRIGAQSAVTGGLYVGGVIGCFDNPGNSPVVLIQNCMNAASVVGADPDGNVGGIVAFTDAATADCANAGSVTGAGSASGIGYIDDNAMRCANTGSVNGVSGAAGITSFADVELSDCYNTGNITATGADARACGVSDGGDPVRNCYNTGTVTAESVENAFAVTSSYLPVNCYTDAAQGTDFPDIAGADRDHRTMAVSADDLKTWGAAYQLNRVKVAYTLNGSGGCDVTATSENDVANQSTWRIDTEGENGGFPVLVSLSGTGTEQDGITPTSTMQKPTGWEQVGAWVEAFDPLVDADPYEGWGVVHASPKIKPDMSVNDGSTADKALQLSTPEALAWFAYQVNTVDGFGATCARLDAGASGGSFDLSGEAYGGHVDVAASETTAAEAKAKYAEALAWEPIGKMSGDFADPYDTARYTRAYKGSFDGGNVAIENLNAVLGWQEYAGLFGFGQGIVVENVFAASGYVEGHIAGGIVGVIEGNRPDDVVVAAALSNCRNSTTVYSGESNAGGLVGYSFVTALTLDRCENTGTVVSSAAAGGMVSYVSGYSSRASTTVNDCYNAGAVKGTAAGGMVAYVGTAMEVAVANCYSIGRLDGSTMGAFVVLESEWSRPVTFAACFYDSDVITGFPSDGGSEGVFAKDTAAFASGEVAWALDTATADGALFDETTAAAGTQPVSRSVWGQKIVRTADGQPTFDSDNPAAYTGDPYPRFWDGTTTGDAFADGVDHPRVAKVSYRLHAPDFAGGEVAPTASFANNATFVALPTSPVSGETWFRWLGDPADAVVLSGSAWSVGEGPSEGATMGDALYRVTLSKSALSWAAVGGAQDEAALRAGENPALAGSGSKDDPYLLNTPEAFAWWAYLVNNRNKTTVANVDGTNAGTRADGSLRAYGNSYATLGADMNLTGNAYGGTEADPLDWVPVGGGSSFDPYADGMFDGGGHGISHMNVEQRVVGSPSGLFGIARGATLVGIHVDDTCEVAYAADDGSGIMAGGIVGMLGGGTVSQCSSAARVSIPNTIEQGVAGGVVGWVTTESGAGSVAIENCFSTGSVAGPFVGGLAGMVASTSGTENVTVSRSFNRAALEGQVLAGGLAAAASVQLGSLVVSSCYNTGSIACAAPNATDDSANTNAIGGLLGAVMATGGTVTVEDSYAAPASFTAGANVLAANEGGLLGRYLGDPAPATASVSLSGCRFENSSGTAMDGLAAVGSSFASAVTGGAVTAAMAEGVTTAGLQDWAAAYKMNGNAYVGDAASTTSTTWTTDNGQTPQNGGYLVYGDLKTTSVTATLDPDDVTGVGGLTAGADGTVVASIRTPLGVAATIGNGAQVVDAATLETDGADASHASVPAMAAAASDVTDNFTAWGTTSAAGTIALALAETADDGTVASRAMLTNPLPEGSMLAASGAAGFDGIALNVGAAYERGDKLTYRTVLASGRDGYDLTITVDRRDSLPFAVDVPVDAQLFELEPDGTVNQAEAVEASTIANKGAAPVTGSVASVEPLVAGTVLDPNRTPDDSSDDVAITDVLDPAAESTALHGTNDAVTESGNVKLGIKAKDDAAGADSAKKTNIGGLMTASSRLPLYFVPGAPGTVPLSFALAGAVDPTAPSMLSYLYFMDYTGLYLPKPNTTEGTFAYQVGYRLAVSEDDVPANAASVTP